MKRNFAMWGSPERKVLGSLSTNTQNIPISPTANLKLLTKVASELEVPVRRKKSIGKASKVLVEPEAKPRKDKSLGMLCDKFLAMFPLNLPQGCSVMEICLDRVAQELGIVKRRIYDIINILESLQMASKVAKNRYCWHGCNKLESTLAQFKALALKHGVDKKLQQIQVQQKEGLRLVSGPTCCKEPSLINIQIKQCSGISNSMLSDCDDYVEDKSENQLHGDAILHDAQAKTEDFFSDERTLGVMSQKFIMLFLASPLSSTLINLDLATRMLVSEASEGGPERLAWGQCHRQEGEDLCSTAGKDCRCQLRLKTKVRRLYDIANVLTSLGLIRKVQLHSTSLRKPVFEYIGPAIESTTACSKGLPYQNNAKHSQPGMSHPTDTSRSDENNESKFVCRKRKEKTLKFGPAEKFSRTSSESTLSGFRNGKQSRHGVTTSCYSAKSSFDDILQVAEQELERLRSWESSCLTPEQPAGPDISAVRKKLKFPRCHSDTCLQPTSDSMKEVSDLDERSEHKSDVSNNKVIVMPFTKASAQGKGAAPAASSSRNVCVTISDTKNKRFTIMRKLVEVPSHILPKTFSEDQPGLKVPSITPLQAQTLQTLFGMSTKQQSSEGTLTVNPVNAVSPPSDVLFLSASEDVLNNNKSDAGSSGPTTSNTEGYVVASTGTKQSFGVLTPINFSMGSSVSPGEVYRAIRVGNTVRLVPLLSCSKAEEMCHVSTLT